MDNLTNLNNGNNLRISFNKLEKMLISNNKVEYLLAREAKKIVTNLKVVSSLLVVSKILKVIYIQFRTMMLAVLQ